MKLRYLSSACIILEDDGVKILYDPWLVDGAYIGSWFHYPPLKFNPEDFNDVDYIYISHIHPDHFDPNTLKRMDKKIPVIINNYLAKFLKNNIEELGFKVTEFNHNERIHLKNNLHLNILAADACNPQLCAQFLGCAVMETRIGATQIDSMSVIDNGTEVVVNVNDCPWELAQHSAKIIKDNYKNIDLLLTGYAGAGGYPQCFDMSEEEKQKEAQNKKTKFLTYGENYINLFKPKYFFPFAGRYTLGGKLFALNKYRGNPEIEEAYEYFSNSSNIVHTKNQCIILNQGEYFDITTEKCSKPYTPINSSKKQEYIEQVISKSKFEYENDSIPTNDEISLLLPNCYDRFEKMRSRIGFISDTQILLDLSDGNYISISSKGEGYKIIPKEEISQLEKYMIFSVDKRLLKRALMGPKLVHWNNIELGSHIWHKKVPNYYERGLYYILNFFYS